MTKLIYVYMVLLVVLLGGGQMCAFGVRYFEDVSDEGIPFEDCGSQLDVLSVTISSCQDVPCEIPLNATVEISVKLEKFENGIEMKSGSEEVADIKQEAFWVFNEVETLAEVQPNLGSYCDEPSIVNTTLKVGEMISNVRGELHWTSFKPDETVSICIIVPVVLVQMDSFTDRAVMPIPMPIALPQPANDTVNQHQNQIR